MGFFTDLIKSKRCSSCKTRKNNRFCLRNGKDICWSCCNETRINRDCPNECKYHLAENDESIFTIRTTVESRTEYDDLIKALFDKWCRLPQKMFKNQVPVELAKTDKGKDVLEKFFLKLPSIELLPINYFRKKLKLKEYENSMKPENPENLGLEFIKTITKLEFNQLTKYMINSSIYEQNKDYQENFVNRISSFKKINKIEEYSLVSAAYTKDQKQCLALYLLNGKWDFTIMLRNVESKWKIIDFWFGIPELLNNRINNMKEIAFLLSKNQLGNAHAALEKYGKTFINFPDIHYYWGLYFLNSKHRKEAKQYFFNAIEIDPYYVAALYNYALMVQGENKLEEAKELYERILELNPKEINTINNLALIYESNKEMDKAEKMYKKCLKIQPDFEMAKKNLERFSE